MNDVDAQLAAAWDGEVPPPRDAAFRIAVLSRIERRRFIRRMVLLAATGAAAIAAIVAFARQLDEAAAALPANAALAVTAGLFVVSAAWGFSRAFRLRLV